MQFIFLMVLVFNIQNTLQHFSPSQIAAKITMSQIINQEGLEAGAEGLLNRAEKKFKHAISIHHNNRKAKLNLVVLRDYGEDKIDYDQARGIFFIALRKGQNLSQHVEKLSDKLFEYYPFLIYQSIFHRHEYSYETALTSINRSIELHPDLPLNWYVRGEIRYIKSNFKGALNDFSQSILLDSAYSFAYLKRGLCYRALGKLDYAILDFEKAIQLNRAIVSLLEESLQIFETYNNRGIKNLKSSQYSNAIDDFKQAIGLNPQFSEPYINLANTYRTMGDMQSALKYYQNAEAIDKNNPEIFYNRGITYAQMDNFAKAIDEYKKTLILDETYTNAFYKIGQILFEDENYEDAIYYFQRTVELDPSNIWAYYLMAISYDNRKRYLEAIDLYNQFIERASDSFYEHRLKASERIHRLKAWLKNRS